MKLQDIILGAVVLALVALGGYTLTRTQTTQPFGASSSAAIVDGCQEVNGLTTCVVRKPLVTATSTPCAIKTPAATSTVVRTSVIIVGATSTQTVWDIAKATTAFATTTLLDKPITLASGIQGTMLHVASTTLTALDSVDVIAPSNYVVWGAEGFFPAGTTKLTGFCEATFVI